jgi:hypothetical protein
VCRESRTGSPVSLNWRLALPLLFFFSLDVFDDFDGRSSPATKTSSGSEVLTSQRMEQKVWRRNSYLRVCTTLTDMVSSLYKLDSVIFERNWFVG